MTKEVKQSRPEFYKYPTQLPKHHTCSDGCWGGNRNEDMGVPCSCGTWTMDAVKEADGVRPKNAPVPLKEDFRAICSWRCQRFGSGSRTTWITFRMTSNVTQIHDSHAKPIIA